MGDKASNLKLLIYGGVVPVVRAPSADVKRTPKFGQCIKIL